MNRLICTILLATTIAASAWHGRIWQTVDGPEIDGTWGKWSSVQYRPIAEANQIERKIYGNSAPTYSIITGYTQQIDEITGKTNSVAIHQAVSCGVLRESGEITAPTEAEWQLWQAWKAAAEAQRIGRLAQQHGAKVGMLANLLSVYGLQIPTSKAEVVAKIESLVAAGTLTAEQTGAIGTIDAVYGIIEATKDENGQSIKDDVAAIWEAMQQ